MLCDACAIEEVTVTHQSTPGTRDLQRSEARVVQLIDVNVVQRLHDHGQYCIKPTTFKEILQQFKDRIFSTYQITCTSSSTTEAEAAAASNMYDRSELTLISLSDIVRGATYSPNPPNK
jgi:hypothetical protein